MILLLGLSISLLKKGDKRETTIDLAAGEHGSWKAKAITSGSLDDWSWVATGGLIMSII